MLTEYQRRLLDQLNPNQQNLQGLLEYVFSTNTRTNIGRLILESEDPINQEYELKLLIEVKERRRGFHLSYNISKEITRFIRAIEELINKGYIDVIQSFNVDPSPTGILFTANLGQAGAIKMILPDPSISSYILSNYNSIYTLTDKGLILIENDYKESHEIAQERSLKTAAGILKLNKYGIALSGLILIIAAVSLFRSCENSSKIEDGMSSVVDNIDELEDNLKDLNDAVVNIVTIVPKLKSSAEKFDTNIIQLNNGLEGIKGNIGGLNGALSELVERSEELNEHYSKEPELIFDHGGCTVHSDSVIIEDLFLRNKGELTARIEGIAIFILKDLLLDFDVPGFQRDSFSQIEHYARFEAKTNISNSIPDQYLRFTGRIILRRTRADLGFTIHIAYSSRNKDELLKLTVPVQCD